MPTMVMDTDSLSADVVTRSVVGQVVNAIAAGDWNALAVCVAADVVYWRPGTGDRIDGVVEYVEEWRRFVREDTTRLSYRPHSVTVQGDTGVVEASVEGALPDGTPVNYSMVSVMRVTGGKLVEEREYIVMNTREQKS
jgi:ketosteroid isomerase-like protein